MFLSIDINKTPIDSNNIIISDKTKNNVISNPNSSYSRILYSNTHVTFNGLLLNFVLNGARVVDSYNKILCHVNDNTIIQKILEIEDIILCKYNSRKNKKYKLAEILKEKCIRIFKNDRINLHNTQTKSITKKIDVNKPVNIILKISGIWEDNKEYGLTMKFFIQNTKN